MARNHRASRTFLVIGTLSLTAAFADPLTGRVPFESDEHLVVVRVSIDSLQDLAFALDTGASSTIVSSRVARRLGLKGSTKTVTAWGTPVQVRQAQLSSLRIGGLEFADVPVQITDLPARSRGDLDGLIGLNLLRRTLVTINFASQEIVFGEARPLEHSTGFYARAPFVLVTLVAQGRLLRLKLDTGAPSLVLYGERVPRGLELIRVGPTQSRRHAGGWSKWQKVSVPEVSLADQAWSDLEGLVLEGAVSSEPGVAGNLGVASLQLKGLQLDFESGRIAWE